MDTTSYYHGVATTRTNMDAPKQTSAKAQMLSRMSCYIVQ